MNKAPPPKKKEIVSVSHISLLDACKVEKYQSLYFNFWLALDLWLGIVRYSVYAALLTGFFLHKAWP